MIKTETRTNGLIYTYSDVGKKIQKVGTDEIYDTAIDLPNAGYTYAETDTDSEITAEEALEIITGGADT
ncbi:MAG: hypothetical protein UEX99_02345 [Acutalibacteraceae bacterium]|jgi:hypothetical protein|nr:hypothetical protein [Acutalibacteraceae bacterium]